MKMILSFFLLINITYGSDDFDNLLNEARNIDLNKNINEQKIKYLDDVISSATKSDFKDLSKLMEQAPTMTPYNKNAKTEQIIFKITRVVEGSIFEKGGLKVGDLVMNGKSPKK
jgi:type II secretory pathway component PulC